MFKGILQNIAYKLYIYGKHRDRIEFLKERQAFIQQQVTIDKSSHIYEKSEIDNHQNDKTKIVIGKDGLIKGDLLLFPFGGKIIMGDNCFIGPGTRLWSAEEIRMGNNVLISHGVNIIDFSHERSHIDRAEGFKNLLKHGLPLEKGKMHAKKIIIEDDVAIYAGANIIMGVTIGKGSIISAGAVVLRDVPPFSLVMGNPAKVVWKLKSE